MAQYVPKTAWKVSNLTKRYGAGFVGLNSGRPMAGGSKEYFVASRQPSKFILDSEGYNSKSYSASQLEERIAAAIHANSGERRITGEEKQPPSSPAAAAAACSFIDLRDDAERTMLPFPFAVALHHHDLLSGACRPLLPTDVSSEIFVIATARQRAVNGFNALRRWGYANVVVADAASLARFSTPTSSNANEEEPHSQP